MQIFKEKKQYIFSILPFFIVILFSAFYRYWNIDNLPGGLFPDEAANGLDINSILGGDLQPFYERGNGREALFFYYLTPFVALFGRIPFSHHFAVATLGVLVVILTYLLTKKWFGMRMAVVASFLTGVSSWYVLMSRTAFRANMSPIFVLLFFYFVTRITQSKKRIDYWVSSVLAGISFGAGFYTYISYRMMIPIVGILMIALFIYDYRHRERFKLFKKYWKAMLVTLLSAVITLIPLILFFANNPEWIIGRSGQVSIFSESLNGGNVIITFLEVLKDTAFSFFTNGDLNWRHNVSSFPFLSFLIAPFFLLGLFLVVGSSLIFLKNLFISKAKKLEFESNIDRLPLFVLVLWFCFMLAPEVLTAEGIPHGLRLVGIIPAIFIISAFSIEEIALTFEQNSKKIKKIFINSIIVLILFFEALYGGFLYFGVAGNSPEYAFAFRSDLTEVSKYLNLRNNKEKTYLVLDLFSEQTVEYQTTDTNNPYNLIDPESLWRGPSKVRLNRDNEPVGLILEKSDQVVFTQSTIYDITAFEKYYNDVEIIYEMKNKWGEKIMVIYQKN